MNQFMRLPRMSHQSQVLGLSLFHGAFKESLTLAHPVYLDTPMLLSFVATMEDGVSLGSTVTENRAKNSSLNISGQADGGTESILEKIARGRQTLEQVQEKELQS